VAPRCGTALLAITLMTIFTLVIWINAARLNHLDLKRRAAEAEMQDSQRSLIASEERYRRLVEVCPDAIFVNRDNRIVFVNEAGLRLFGATRAEEILGKSPFDVFHDEFHDVIREHVRIMIEQHRNSPLIEMKVIRLDTTIVEVSSKAATMNRLPSFVDLRKDLVVVPARQIFGEMGNRSVVCGSRRNRRHCHLLRRHYGTQTGRARVAEKHGVAEYREHIGARGDFRERQGRADGAGEPGDSPRFGASRQRK
jgi:PAS domain S-box-containing protein